MTQYDNISFTGTITDYIEQQINDPQHGKEFALEYLRAEFLASAAEALFNARHTAHLTQKQVAERLGKKQSAIARWEADVDGKMSFQQFVDLALACGMVPESLKLVPIEQALHNLQKKDKQISVKQ
jgi:DNA-binding transcriptional regulator YiaG